MPSCFLGIVIMSEPVLSYGYTIKQPVKSETFCIWKCFRGYRPECNSGSCPAGTGFMEGLFVDEESRQIQLSAMRSGTILEGEELVIPYANSLNRKRASLASK